MNYRIEHVPLVGNNVDVITALHEETFGMTAPVIRPLCGEWWLALADDVPIAFAGVEPSAFYFCAAYLCRVGVLPQHRGRGLQVQIMRVIEAFGRSAGWKLIVSDTTQNPPSANSFIKCGFTTFIPSKPWSFKNATYWRKELPGKDG